MDTLIRILIERLINKGMEISTIPAYIRDLANTIAVQGYSGLGELNTRLQSLGWDDFELDEYTLELVAAIFEPDNACKPSHWFERTISGKVHDN
jgi:hypothetical protein